MKKLLYCFCLFFFVILAVYNRAWSQVGPNVVVGAGKMVMNSGALDSDLIIDMIATKRGEIKSELGRRLILKSVENGSFTFYNYAEKNLNLLMNEPKAEVITKELMRNSAELMLIYLITEAYLKDLAGRTSITTEEYTFLTDITSYMPYEQRTSFYELIGLNTYNSLDGSKGPGSVSMKVTADNIYGFSSSDLVVSNFGSNDLQLGKPIILPVMVIKNKYYDEVSNINESNVSFNPAAIIVDLVMDVCKSNKSVLQTGLFQNDQYSIEKYRSLNKYFAYLNKSNKIQPGLTVAGQETRERISRIIDLFFQYYALFQNLGTSIYEVLDENRGDENVQTKMNELEESVRSLCWNYAQQVDNSLTEMRNNFYNEISLVFKNRIDTDNPKVLSDLWFHIDNVLKPQLSSLSFGVDGTKYVELMNGLDNTKNTIKERLLVLLGNSDTNLNEIVNGVDQFVGLLFVVNNLDRVESYDYIFKFITNVADTYGSPKAKTVVGWMTASVEKYTAINLENNNLTIDAESMINDLYTKYAQNQKSKLNLMLTVGANYSDFNFSERRSYHKVLLADDSTFRGQVGYVSEKVGLRYNIFDWNRKRMFGEYRFYNRDGTNVDWAKAKRRGAKTGRDPLIDNLHIQAYGSGLLYNINALNSSDVFDKPIFGTGIGITFFNGLDFSCNWAGASGQKYLKEGLLTLSFDISLSEYLGALKIKKESK